MGTLVLGRSDELEGSGRRRWERKNEREVGEPREGKGKDQRRRS